MVATGNSNALAKSTTGFLSAEQQTKMIDAFSAKGASFEKIRKWSLAEDEYKSALRMIAKRDGVGM